MSDNWKQRSMHYLLALSICWLFSAEILQAGFLPRSTTEEDQEQTDSSTSATLRAYPIVNDTGSNFTQDRQNSNSDQFRLIKKTKLELIKQHILSSLGFTQAPNITIAKRNNYSLSDMKKCYRPTCRLPTRSTDEELWNNSTSTVLNLHFNVTSPRSKLVTVKNATLWLHLQMPQVECPCNDAIVINVYILTKALKKNQRKPRRRLAAVRIVKHQGDSWQDFDMQGTVSDWLEQRKNFGLQIIIKDRMENLLNARDIISHTDCSQQNPPSVKCWQNSQLIMVNGNRSALPILIANNHSTGALLDVYTEEKPKTRRIRLKKQ
ncbi:XP_014784591.1PREDICTED: uncharacterized protein LOC106879500 [Octopus vulgaris]|nr:XP_014784591.1PREDICTED: uncharacterized protein LOC106879500 [Octopus vulgaris]